MGHTPPVNRQPSTMGIGRGINRQIKIGRGIERDQGIDRSRHGLSRLSLSLGEWTGGTRDRAERRGGPEVEPVQLGLVGADPLPVGGGETALAAVDDDQ